MMNTQKLLPACYKHFWLVPLLLFLWTPYACADYDTLIIDRPFLRKVPLAIPAFKLMSGADDEKQFATKGLKILTETLEFTGFFEILDPASFLESPRETGIMISNINFRNWTAIGAELMITAGLLKDGDRLEMEFRLLDTFKERMLIGKRYKAQETELRKIVLKFCSEIIRKLTGNAGIFESKIAFISNGSGHKEIFICDFDGHAPKQFTHNNNITLSPAWSHDGQWLAYTSYKKGKPDIYIQHLTENRGAIIDLPGTNIAPAWKPGAFQLAATLSCDGNPEIYLLTGAGKKIKRLTKNRALDVSPTFSPDGSKIAFTSKRSGSPQIFIMDLNSGETRRLTYQGKHNTSPCWSPDGDKIAYVGIEKNQIDIFVIKTDGTHVKQLTQNTGDNESPTWSPDGSLIAFSSTREGASRIYIMTAYGTDQRRLLKIEGEQTNPKWSHKVTAN